VGDDVIVVGGGVSGASIAYHLAEAGLSVRLLERGSLASESSGAAAGMLLPIGEARGKDPLLAWGMRSLAAFPDLVDALLECGGFDPEYEPSGALHLATSATQEVELREKARSVVAFGAGWLEMEEVRARVPVLGDVSGGALWCPREGHVRSDLLVRGLAASAAALGARIEEGRAVEALLRDGERVVGVEVDGERLLAGHVVLCTGAFSGSELLGDLPFSLPVEPIRGQILALDGSGIELPHVVKGEGAYLVPRRNREIWVGATEERVGFDARVTAEGVSSLLEAGFALAPGLEGCAFLRAWAGLRPATPDGLPCIGRIGQVEGLIVAAGHHRNGVLLAPVTGQLVLDLVRHGRLADDAAPFSPLRFAA
jgi:glycine oxidase